MDGLYDVGDWGFAAIAALALLLGAVAAGIPRLRPRAIVACAALAALWLWAWLSVGWAESADQALEGAYRWLFYAALLGALVMLARDPKVGLAVLGAATAGVLVSALYVLGELSGGTGSELFLGARLTEPLGYTNGQAAYFFMAMWPLVAHAEVSRRSWIGGLAVAASVLLAGLVVLSQTRAIVPAVLVTAIVVFAVVPGRLRRLGVLLCVGAGVAIALPSLLDVYSDGIGDDELESAARALMLGAVVGGALWALADFVLSRASQRSTPFRRTLSRTGTAAVAGVGVVALFVALANAGRIVDEVDQQYDSFVDVTGTVDADAGSRFTSAGGARYDYWRVAWEQFKEKPLHGYGAGNYDRTYFLERESSEDVRQPHSIELQALAELGIPGLLALLAFIGAVAAGLGRAARMATESPPARAAAVGAGGAFVAWLSHTSVDWLHVIPGLTGIALAAAAVLLAPRERQRRLALSPRLQVVTIGAAVLVTVVGALGVGRLAAADRLREESAELVDSDPAEALRKANESLDLNDESVPGQIAKAAALARFNAYEEARAALLEATRLEPHDFVPWGLLGDLAARRGDLDAARTAYRRSRKLNPTDPFVGPLADDPSSAVPLEEE